MKSSKVAILQYDPARIVEARKSKGYSQEELAFAAGLSLRTIQRIEKGEVHPRLYSLKALAASLDCALGQFQRPAAAKTGPKEGLENWMVLSIYTVVILPFLPLLLQSILLYRATDLTDAEVALCRQRLHFQGGWLAALVLTLLSQPLVSLILSGQVSNGDFPLSFLIYLLFIAVNMMSIFIPMGCEGSQEGMT